MLPSCAAAAAKNEIVSTLPEPKLIAGVRYRQHSNSAHGLVILLRDFAARLLQQDVSAGVATHPGSSYISRTGSLQKGHVQVLILQVVPRTHACRYAQVKSTVKAATVKVIQAAPLWRVALPPLRAAAPVAPLAAFFPATAPLTVAALPRPRPTACCCS